MRHSRNSVCLVLFFIFSAPNAFAVLRGRPIKDAKGCVTDLTAGPRARGNALIKVAVPTTDPLVDLLLNKPREIASGEYDESAIENRRKQIAKAIELGDQIADMILDPKVVGHEERMLAVHSALSENLGQVPSGAMDQLKGVLNVNLGALRRPDQIKDDDTPFYKNLQFDEASMNAIGELERVLTTCRYEADAVLAPKVSAVNKIANVLHGLKLTKARTASEKIREIFQTAGTAIDVILKNLEGDIAKKQVRKGQLEDGRVTAAAVENYEQIAMVVANRVEQRFETYLEDTEMTEADLARFEEDYVNTLNLTRQMVLDNRSTAALGYSVVRRLAAQNQKLLVMFSNARKTAEFDLVLMGASQIITNEQAQDTDRLTSYYKGKAAMHESIASTVLAVGKRIDQMPTKVIAPSIERTITALDGLLVGIRDLRAQNEQLPRQLREMINKSWARLDALGPESGLVSYTEIVEEEARKVEATAAAAEAT